MPRSKVYALAVACVLVLTWGVAAQATYDKVQFPYNDNLQEFVPSFPSGDQTYYGVPFFIPTSGNNYWDSLAVTTGSESIVLTISLDIAGATQVYTLINTHWGDTRSTSDAYLTFTGSDGATYTKDLYGNVDIRDYSYSIYTNSINGTTTQNAVLVDYNTHRLDMQFITLPEEFADQSLTKITLTDNGDYRLQRTFLAGLTVEYSNPIPLPSTLLLLGSGLAGLVGLRGFRRR